MEIRNVQTCNQIFSFYLNLIIEAIFIIYKKMMSTSELEFNSFLEDFGQLYKNFKASISPFIASKSYF